MTMRLSQAQLAWLADPRPYSHPDRDRTFRALIKRGVVKIDEENWDKYNTGKAAYIITDLGKSLIQAANS